jgi:hypothetical protein
LWASRKRDTLLTVFREGSKRTTYTTQATSALYRTGAVEVSDGGGKHVYDTLRETNDLPKRTIHCSFDADSQAYSVEAATGFSVVFRPGSLHVDSQDPEQIPNALWTSENGAWRMRAVVGGESSDTVLAGTITESLEGYLSGEMSLHVLPETEGDGATADLETPLSTASSIIVTPLYTGSARLFGVFDNVPEDLLDNPDRLHTPLQFELWGAGSTIGSRTVAAFQLQFPAPAQHPAPLARFLRALTGAGGTARVIARPFPPTRAEPVELHRKRPYRIPG